METLSRCLQRGLFLVALAQDPRKVKILGIFAIVILPPFLPRGVGGIDRLNAPSQKTLGSRAER